MFHLFSTSMCTPLWPPTKLHFYVSRGRNELLQTSQPTCPTISVSDQSSSFIALSETSYILPHCLLSYHPFPIQSFLYVARATILLDALINSKQIASCCLQALCKTTLHSTNKLISLSHFSPCPFVSQKVSSLLCWQRYKSTLLSQAFTVPTTSITVFSSLAHSAPHHEPLFTGKQYQHTRLSVF